jgi:LysM repeat protein
MSNGGREVDREDLRPGDLVVYWRNEGRRSTHIGIYTGDGKFIHSPHTGDFIKESDAFDQYHRNLFLKAIRVIDDPEAAPLPEKRKKEIIQAALSINRPETVKTAAKKQAPSAASAGPYTIYRVKKGDVVSKIAARYDLSTRDVLKANGLSSRSVLRVGQKLKIPNDPAAASDPPVQTASLSRGFRPQKPAEKPGARFTEYTVKKGDVISKIAARHDVSTADVLKANGLGSRSVLKIGQKIKIPAPGGNSAPAARPEKPPEPAPRTRYTEYTVKKGDVISKIAARHDVSTNDVLKANGLGSRSVLKIGQKIKIPAAGGNSVPEKKPDSAERRKHDVQKGDTLWVIARDYGVTLEDIMRANGLSRGTTLRVGQTLTIP